MIIDAHMHLLKDKNFNKPLLKKYGINVPKNTPIEIILDWFNKLNLKKAVIMGQEMKRIWDSDCGEDYILEIYQKYKDKFITLASVKQINNMNKFDKESFEYLKNITEKGFRGFLMTPPYGQYFSNDRRIYPFYEFAQEKNLIVQFHHGAIFGPPILNNLKYTNLLDLNDVMIDFPNLKIVIEHLAFPWTEQLMALMANNPNLYTDISLLYDQKTLTTWRLVMAKEYKVIDRVMYASDYWSCREETFDECLNNFKRWIYFIKKGINEICSETKWPPFSQREIEGILWRNAATLYEINI